MLFVDEGTVTWGCRVVDFKKGKQPGSPFRVFGGKGIQKEARLLLQNSVAISHFPAGEGKHCKQACKKLEIQLAIEHG